MLQRLQLDATEDTPIVDFDASTGLLSVIGRALPEDAHSFFSPIQIWVQDYVRSPAENTVIDLRIDYFNSAATRYIFNILLEFEKLTEDGKNVRVIWNFSKADEMIAAKGEELESMLDIQFEMRPF
ncbi:MAG: DUF1987 domain-containing protein [Flavobacteriales bacterium]|nr:DUF1987 domain-containing protein [Flavobacteriales bacterium]